MDQAVCAIKFCAYLGVWSILLLGTTAAPPDTEITYVKLLPALQDSPDLKTTSRESRIENLPLTIPGIAPVVDNVSSTIPGNVNKLTNKPKDDKITQIKLVDDNTSMIKPKDIKRTEKKPEDTETLITESIENSKLEGKFKEVSRTIKKTKQETFVPSKGQSLASQTEIPMINSKEDSKAAVKSAEVSKDIIKTKEVPPVPNKDKSSLSQTENIKKAESKLEDEIKEEINLKNDSQLKAKTNFTNKPITSINTSKLNRKSMTLNIPSYINRRSFKPENVRRRTFKPKKTRPIPTPENDKSINNLKNYNRPIRETGIEQSDPRNENKDSIESKSINDETVRLIRSDVTTENYESETTEPTDNATERDEELEVAPQTIDLETRTKSPTPRFLSKLSYFKKQDDDVRSSIATNFVETRGRRRFKSKCRCEKIWNCPKLQITVPRCPNEYFMCCF